MRWLMALTLLIWPLGAWAQDQATRDRGLVQAFLEDNLSGAGRDVRIDGFAGALSGRATIDTMTIADTAGVWLTLSDVVLDWDRAAMLSGRLVVRELSAARLAIPRAPVAETGGEVPSATASGAFVLPELPVSVDIGALRLDRVDLGAPLLGQAATLRVTGSANLSGGAGQATLAMRRIDQGPRGQFVLRGAYDNATRGLALELALDEAADGLAASLIGLPGRPALEMRVVGDAPIDDFRADIAMATDGQDRLTGAVSLGTARDAEGRVTRRLRADLGGDVTPVFAPRFRAFFGPDVRFVLEAVETPDGRRALEALQVTTRSLALAGTAALAADGWPERISLTGQIADPSGQPVLMPIGVEGLTVGRADLTVGYDRAAGDTWRASARVRNVAQGEFSATALEMTGSGRLRLPKIGRAGGVGGSVDLAADGIALVDPAQAAALGAALRGGLRFFWSDGAPLSLRDIALEGVDYGLTGTMDLTLPEQGLDLLAKLNTRLRAADLTRFKALAGMDLAGAADLAITGTVAPVAGAIDLAFDGTSRDLALGQPRLDPLLAGDGRLALRLTRDAQGTGVEGLAIATDHARISGAARAVPGGGTLDLAAVISEMARAEPTLAGPGRLALRATGAEDQWQSSATLDLPGQTRLAWEGRVTDPLGTGNVAGVLRLGTERLGVFAALLGQPLGGAVSAQADVTGRIADLSGRVNLTATSRDLRVGVPLVDAQMRGAGRLTAKLRRGADGRVIVDRAELVTPGLSAQVQGQMTDSAQELAFSARLADGAVIADELSGPVTAEGAATRGTGDWRIALRAAGSGGTTLATNGTVAPDARRADLTLAGSAPLSLVNARLRPRSLTGIARYDLRLDGPLALSSLSGQILANDARLTLPDLRMALGEIGARVVLDRGRAIVDVSGAVSTGGTVWVRGPVGLEPPFDAALNVQLFKVGLRDGSLYRTSASGTVTVVGPLRGGAVIGGVIDLGQTEVRVPSSLGPSYANLPGLVHVNEAAEVRRTRSWAGLLNEAETKDTAEAPEFAVDLAIRAPSRIFVRGRGLDAELGGVLRLGGTVAALEPQGRFDLVRGRLDVLGQRLVLTEGYLQMQGSFDPYLRFAATSTAQDTTITLALAGLASAPELILSSSPELPQDEILSLLLFGRDITQISAVQAVRLATALRTLSGQGGEGLAAGIRRSLRLDDLDVTTTEDGVIEARAGAYLSRNLYSDVSVNAEGQTQINLNLKLSNKLTVRGRLGSDGNTGVGIFFEKDY